MGGRFSSTTVLAAVLPRLGHQIPPVMLSQTTIREFLTGQAGSLMIDRLRNPEGELHRVDATRRAVTVPRAFLNLPVPPTMAKVTPVPRSLKRNTP
jgi:hypothetical protein